MAKNNYLIQQEKRLKKQIDEITPKIYASLALALHSPKYNWTTDQIAELFGESQDIWIDSVQDNLDMLQLCYALTGIELRKGDKYEYRNE